MKIAEKNQLAAARKALLRMMVVDQRMRKRAMKTGVWNPKVDRENTKTLKGIIEQIGWPTISKVGRKASHAAWLLAQHADLDVRFQKKVLAVIKKAYRQNNKDIAKKNIAYLTDRVAVNEKRKQSFGTQFYLDRKENYSLYPVRDMKGIEKRREEYGLPPLKKYIESMQSQKIKWRKDKKTK